MTADLLSKAYWDTFSRSAAVNLIGPVPVADWRHSLLGIDPDVG
jgi:hypothetical protein